MCFREIQLFEMEGIVLLSNKGYRAVGDRIRSNPNDISDEDLRVIQSLRIAHKEDLSYVFECLVEKLKRTDKSGVVTYRIKRIESIISKLLRQPEMQLNRMSDVAGCRCIVHNNSQLYALYNKLKESGLIVVHEKDYVKEVKPTGYRSIHLIVKAHLDSKYTIEVQLRTQEQHNWATLVETTDLVYRTKLKECGGGHPLELFHKNLSIPDEELSVANKKTILELAQKFDYIARISNIYEKNYELVRAEWNECRNKGHEYILIATGSDGIPEIQTFYSFQEAEDKYLEKYIENPHHKNIVLTHIRDTSFENVSMAYSNYFMTYNALLYRCYRFAADVFKYEFEEHNRMRMFKWMNYFMRLTIQLVRVSYRDIAHYKFQPVHQMSPKKRKEWSDSIKKHMRQVVTIFNGTYKELMQKSASYSLEKICLHLNLSWWKIKARFSARP